jgi:uncharacterized protein (TIGR02145 family)
MKTIIVKRRSSKNTTNIIARAFRPKQSLLWLGISKDCFTLFAMTKSIFKTVMKIRFTPVFFIFSFFFFSVVACKKSSTAPAIETGTMTDRDGNVYSTVKIGSQWWMAQDLKVTTYQNGDSVKFKSSTNVWQDTTSGYCVYPTSQIGLLYNFYAVNDARKLAPAGWHIPTDNEWKQLEQNLGMSSLQADSIGWRGKDQGDQLKMGESADKPVGNWSYCDAYGPANNSPIPPGAFIVWPTNSTGFTAMAGSCRLFNGTFGFPGLGQTGFWWSSSIHNDKAWYRYLDYNKPNVFRYYGDKRYGFSIRCVKD